MPMTYMQMVAEAQAAVPAITARDVYQAAQHNPHLLIVDLCDVEDTGTTGVIPQALNISLGMLPIRADQELPEPLRHPPLQDRSRLVITTCETGYHAALGARLLKQIGFTDVRYMQGGMQAW